MKKLVFGILLAAFCWFMMFSLFPQIAVTIHNNYFWYAMSFSTLILTIYTLYHQKNKLKVLFHFEKKFVYIGIIHGIVLYGISNLGVYIISNFFEFAKPQLNLIYMTRDQASPILIASLLLFVIAPAEEIFWRGFVQDKLGDYVNKKNAMRITILLYMLVHIWALNPMLLLAALVLGVHWGYMYYRFGSLIPGIISHALWDTIIFVILPISLN
jgi:membrane protease YdiL (CAAX protease family)